jgi:hypothetical protein
MLDSEKIIFVGSIYGKKRMGYDGSVYHVGGGICPTILTNSITAVKMLALIDSKNERQK